MTREDNVYYNASGCADPTAATAIHNIYRETKTMEEARAGEIWKTDDGRMVLVVSTGGRLMNYTLLNYDDNGYCDIHINGMHANSRMLAYRWLDVATDFVRKLADDEFSGVLDTIAETLGIKTCSCGEVSCSSDSASYIDAYDDVEEQSLLGEIDRAEEEKAELLHENAMLLGKIAALESMNDRLLGRLVG